MFETSYIEIHADQFYKNLEFIKHSVSGKAEVCSVIKGNAYGHGVKQIITLAQHSGVKHFAVFNAHEAMKALPYLNDGSRMIIMGDLHPEQIPWAIESEIEFYVFSLEHLQKAVEAAQKINKKARIHLEIETGMNRLGIEEIEYSKVVKFLQDSKAFLTVCGICTHYAGAESINNFVRVKKQMKKYDTACRYFENSLDTSLFKHSACSAAAIRLKKTRHDMTRIGILQYGLWPSQETFIEYVKNRSKKISPIQGILSWKSRVMALKDVTMGEYVGYGSSFLTEDNKKMAIIPIGYSNGFSRSLSNQGRVLIRGKRAPVAGIVNMNAITVDVTDIGDVQIGDEVVLIGQQGDHSISVASFSDYSNQLNYELLTRLPDDIPRNIV